MYSFAIPSLTAGNGVVLKHASNVQGCASAIEKCFIDAGYYENNIGSAKVLQKCGFVVEGIKHSDVIFEKERIKSVLVGYVAN